MVINREEAKQFLVSYQGLDNSDNQTGKSGILDFIQRVGSIQYDTLNIVGRNPDLVLQSRIKNYSPKLLQELLYSDRLLIDGWDKTMSIYPTPDWPFFTKLRETMAASMKRGLKRHNSAQALNYTDHILQILITGGPKLSSQIDYGTVEKGKWRHRKIAGAALDYLFQTGRVGVYQKKGVQKVYDLIENLIPGEILSKTDPFLTVKDFHKWLILRRVGSVGLFWNTGSIVWQGVDKDFSSIKYRKELFEELAEQGLLKEVSINGMKQQFYTKSDTSFTTNTKTTPCIRFLAPLDNLLWDRNLALLLFDFDYKWEVYTPHEKRKFGYYVLPILFGSDFIGRIEPVMDKENNELVIKNIWFEHKGTAHKVKEKSFKNHMKKALSDFCKYLGCANYKDESGYKFS